MALVSKGPSQGQGEHMKKKKDLSKVKCFRCGELCHYSTQFHLRKKDKEEKKEYHTTFAEIDRLSSKLEEESAMFVDIPKVLRWGDLIL